MKDVNVTISWGPTPDDRIIVNVRDGKLYLWVSDMENSMIPVENVEITISSSKDDFVIQ